MPFTGFQVHERIKGVALPKDVVYTYTWDIKNLVGEDVVGGPLIYLQKVSLPAVSFDIEEVKTGHAIYKFPKQTKWEDVKVSFYDTNKLAKTLDDMCSNVWSPSTGIRPVDSYVADTVINVYYSHGVPAYKWTLKNSWVKSVSYSELTYESSGINNANIVIVYTWAELEAF